MMLDISEYIDTSHGNPIEPPVAHQAVPIGPEAARSKPFHKLTRVVRLAADVNCLVSFCNSPFAILPAGKPELRIVQPGESFDLSVQVADPVGDQIGAVLPGGDQIGALLRVIGDPKAAAERKAELEKLLASVKSRTSALAKRQEELDRRQAEYEAARAKLDQDKSAFEQSAAASGADLAARESAVAEASAAFHHATTETDAELKRREADVTRREDEIAERVRTLNEDERTVKAAMTDMRRRQELLRRATE